MANDFKSRQRNEQLPADPGGVRFPGSQSMAASDAAFAQTPNGPPLGCVDVRSVYDVRPINAFDFNIAGTAVLQSSSVGQNEITFTVPDGFVCVLRSMDLWVEPNSATERSDAMWSLMLQGTTFPYNDSVPFGGQQDDIAVFLVADEFNRVGVRIGGSSIGGQNGFAIFYGQFLPKTGLQFNMEIGNRTQNCGPMPVQPTPVLRPPTSTPTPATPPIVRTPPPPKKAPPIQPFPRELTPAPVVAPTPQTWRGYEVRPAIPGMNYRNVTPRGAMRLHGKK